MRRSFQLSILILLSAFTGLLAAGTSTFTLITISGPGSQADTAARYFARELETNLGQTVQVVNATGGAGLTAMHQFREKASSCDSALIGNAAMLFSAEKASSTMDIDVMRDFVPVHGFAKGHALVVVPFNSKVRELGGLVRLYIEEQRLRTGATLPQTNASVGFLDQALRVKSKVTTYKTSPLMLAALEDEELDYAIVLTGTAAMGGLLESGRLRAIAALDDEGHPGYPDVKSVVQQGYKPIEVFYWSNLFVNREATPACREWLTKAARATLYSPRGEKFSSLPGAPQRFLATADEVKELMTQQLRKIQQLPTQ